MSSRRPYERVEEIRGYKYIRLKGGRLITFWDAHTAADRAETDLARAVSRAMKLADGWHLERVAWFMEELDDYVHAVLKEIEERRGVKTQEERIALLRNTSGRTPEEAEAFRRKADELERRLHDSG